MTYRSVLWIIAMLLTVSFSQGQENEQVKNKYYSTSEKADLTGLNFLLITSDQHHWMTLGYNDPTVKTPNLDRLARKGMLLDRAYASNPTCTPSRASIITGQMPSQHGAYVLGTKTPEEVVTFAEVFSANDYETALVGKAHFQPVKGSDEFPSIEAYPTLQNLEFWEKMNEPFYGFDHIELARNHGDEPHIGQHYLIWIQEKLKKEGRNPDEWKQWFRKPTGENKAQHGEWNMPEAYHMNTWIAERSNLLLEKYAREGKHFILWSSFFDPHPPYLVPGKWANMYDPEKIKLPEVAENDLKDMPEIYQMTQEKGADFSKYKDSEMWSAGLNYQQQPDEVKKQNIALYYGMISMMDHYIGKILDKLEELGLDKNTVIVYTTDHGHLFGQHNLLEKGPFLFEDLVKVPFIASCPGLIPENTRSNDLFSLIDLAPTFLELAGMDVPLTMTGMSQSTMWQGQKKAKRDFVIVENHQQPYSLYQKQLITDRYKITVYMNSTNGELFDLQNDPHENTNLWNDKAWQEIKNQLILKLVQSTMKEEPLKMPRTGDA